jgi:hypothetical protein
MKVAKLVFAASIACGSMSAAHAAFVYDNGYNVGKATVKSNGGCAMQTKVFNNARYGDIYDVEGGSYIGYGVVDASGNIIATENDYTKKTGTSQKTLATSYVKSKNVWFEDFVTSATVNYIQGQSGCSIGYIMPLTTSQEVYTYSGPEMGPPVKQTISLQASLTGYTSSQCVNTTTSKTSTDKCVGKKFSASVTFKGQ